MNFIDLFAGAGGLSEGFIRAGFNPVAHVEMDTAACYTLRTRAAYHYLKTEGKEDIYFAYLQKQLTRAELYSHIPGHILSGVINLPIGKEFNPRIHKEIRQQPGGQKIDLIIGGPPCQAYSLVGRARSVDGMKNDPRNFLFVEYANFLEEYTPKYFVFENVMGLHSANGGKYLEKMRQLFKKKGYEIKLHNLEANNFDVLQHRRRVVIIGWREDLKPDLPDLEAVRSTGEYKVKDIFTDLPKINAGEGIDRYSRYHSKPSKYLKVASIRNGVDILTQHITRPHTEQDKKIYKIAVSKWNKEGERLNYNDLPDNLKTHKNRNSFIDRFKVVAEDLNFSHTVVAHIAKDGHYYIHPDIDQNRSLSVREAARLQSFPDDFYFEGVKEGMNRTAAFKQIGNAVPPLMAEKIAKTIKAFYKRF
ncbi:DNA cytosine methyltransferase [Longitalea arenae]|uniref:DNA cytosine methyltransferase n=1 Tax=Longitalea arenae TaxID=2812558 RepID=UPI001966F8DD|nr:DNA (cytosine-5-)-methyltransferase [Longitalea arenae]